MIDPLDTGDLQNDTARRLALSRIALGGGQAEFGKSAGLSQPRYSAYENGIRPLTLNAAMQLCHRYNLTLDWLYRGDPSGLAVSLHERLKSVAREHGEKINAEMARARATERRRGRKPISK